LTNFEFLKFDFICVCCHRLINTVILFFSRPCLSTYFIRRRRKRFSTNEHWIETQSSAKKRKNNYKRKLNKVQPDLSPKTAGKAPICLKPANSQTSASSLMRKRSSATVSCLLSKILALRSFQIIHEVRMTKESKHFRSAFCNLLRERDHQMARDSSRLPGVRKCHLKRSKMLNQSSLAKEQPSSR